MSKDKEMYTACFKHNLFLSFWKTNTRNNPHLKNKMG